MFGDYWNVTPLELVAVGVLKQVNQFQTEVYEDSLKVKSQNFFRARCEINFTVQ